MHRRLPLASLAAGFVCAGLVALLAVLVTGGIASSFFDPDEPAHYVNSLFLGDWIRAGLPSPMAFARDYYAHFPKLSIGHWPPGWYALLTPVFATLRPSPFAALALSAFVAGLPGGLILWAARRMGLWRVGLVVTAAYLILPLVLDGARRFLLDQPVTLVVGLAAIAWVRATERPGWGRFLIFAVLAAYASLVKGNGALIALVPAIDIALGQRWRLLREPALWGSAVLALAIVGPWYWLSFKISAGGFNYAPGLSYAGLALAANWNAILANVGWSGVTLAATGTAAAWAGRGGRPQTARIAALSVAVILATFLFQSAVPVAIEPRYVTPLLPWTLVLAGIGLAALWQRGTMPVRAAAVALGVAALVPAIANLIRLPEAPDIDATKLSARIGTRPGIWLVDGRSGGEGAVIAAAAYADDGRKRVWVARASQWLSTSDFMGRDYRVTATSPAAARQVLAQLGVVGVVSVADHDRLAYPHSAILRAAVTDGAFVQETIPFRRGPGSTLVAIRRRPIDPKLTSLGSGSANLAKMNAALD